MVVIKSFAGNCRIIFTVCLIFFVLLLSPFHFAQESSLNKGKPKDSLNDLYKYIDNNKGFAYIPVKLFPKQKNYEPFWFKQICILESLEEWKISNPNKVIVQIVGDGLGEKGSSSGYFIVYKFSDKIQKMK